MKYTIEIEVPDEQSPFESFRTIIERGCQDIAETIAESDCVWGVYCKNERGNTIYEEEFTEEDLLLRERMNSQKWIKGE